MTEPADTTSGEGASSAPDPLPAAGEASALVEGKPESAPVPAPASGRLAAPAPETSMSLAPESRRVHDARKRIGTSLKGWRLAKLLGVGPATATYEARKGPGDAGERAVVRVLQGGAAKSERGESQFLRAAYAASRFTHPRVVPVTADGLDDDGVPFTVRPWIDAEPLPGYAKANPLDDQRVLRVAEQLLDILEIAHAHGIVHGELRPENVLLTSRGSARLIDFSIPPGLSARADSESPLAALRVGAYTTPERCAPDGAATEQGDVWSVGAVMFFALTGEPPRGGVTTREGLAEAPARPLRDVLREVPEAVAAVVDHALNRDPALRYESAYAMLGDVRRVMAGRPPKLARASGAVPSGVLADASGPPSTFRPPPFRTATATPGSSRSQTGPNRGQGGSQWKGNVTLVVLIAALLAAATYVMIREKAEEQQRGPAPISS